MNCKLFYRVTVLLLVCAIFLVCFAQVPQASALSLRLYHLNSLEEYEAELARHDLPGDYVTYDMIKMVGDFHSLYLGIFPTLTPESINYIDMTLVDDAGFRIKFEASCGSVKQRSLYEDYPTDYTVSDPHDLRRTQTAREKFWKYKLGQISYIYFNDELYGIEWEHNGRFYDLLGIVSDEERLYLYPKDTADTFLDRLLDADTAQEAIRELNASIDRGQVPLKWKEFQRNVPGYIAVVAVMLLIAAAWISVNKSIKKEKLQKETGEAESVAGNRDT